jgi:K+-transporting ATPase ATPase A chain
MTVRAVLQIAAFLAVLTALAVPLGAYLQRVFTGRRLLLERVLGPVERRLYRVLRTDPGEEQSWSAYATSLLVFSALCLGSAYLLLRTQAIHPLNPHGFRAMPWDVSLNTAVSFVTNTSWQFYAGETSLSLFSQMVVIALQSYLSAAVGLAVGVAVIRGFVRRDGGTGLGNFWSDLVRSLLYVILPICTLASLFFVAQGVPQGVGENAIGTVATWEPIKTLGSVGGGFFNVNSAMPYENPTALSSFMQALLIVLGPAALLHTFGRMTGNRRQGWTLYGVTVVLFAAGALALAAAEHRTTPAQTAAGVHGSANLEGKEVRFGTAGTALYAQSTTTGSSGAVNGAMESLTAGGAAVGLVNMLTGETVFGGIGVGLTGILLLALLSVFLAGLMVGRTPEFLGKRLEAREVKLLSIGTLAPPMVVLACTAVAVSTDFGAASRFATDTSQAFTEHLWAYTSQTMNNGSAFAGYTGFVQPNAPGNEGAYGISFANVLGSFAMLAGRFVPIVAALAVAGALAPRRVSISGAGTLRTDNFTFATVLAFVVVVVVVLSFLPALALGPLAGELR